MIKLNISIFRLVASVLTSIESKLWWISAYISEEKPFQERKPKNAHPFLSCILNSHIMNQKFCTKWETKSQGLSQVDPWWLWSPGLPIFTWERSMSLNLEATKAEHGHCGHRTQICSPSCPCPAWVSSLHRSYEQPSTFQTILFFLGWWELLSVLVHREF